MFEGGIITKLKHRYMKQVLVFYAKSANDQNAFFRAKYLIPEKEADEPALEPLGIQHILFPNMFLGAGLFLGFVAFLAEFATQRGKITKMSTTPQKTFLK